VRPTLPQHDTATEARAAQLAESRQTYRYDYSWPKGVATAAELPRSENYSPSYVLHSAGVYARIGANLAAVTIDGFEAGGLANEVETEVEALSSDNLRDRLFKKPQALGARIPKTRPKTWDEFEKLFRVWQTPDVVAFYHRTPADLDLAFAWQRVAGVNPMVLARCPRVPDHLAVTDALYARVMGGGDTLAAATAEGRLYLADYALLDGIATGTTDGVQKYLAAPLALFAVDRATQQLRPVAIQVGQTPATDAVFTPADGWRWRMAQTLVQIADANHHEGFAHLGRTHLVMEAVKLAFERNLARSHPLYPLLEAHTETTLAINESAKTSLIAPGGTVDRCFAPAIEAFAAAVKTAVDTYPIRTATPLHDLEARGLDDLVALPTHPYRDDVRIVWSAVERFVGEYVGLYYTSDDDVRGDTELQAFVRELGADDGGRLKDVPEVNTVADVAALIAKLVFIAGPGHSCVNYPQFPYMGFVTNMPGASYCPPPTADTPDSEDAYVKMLPSWDIAVEDTTMIYLLSEVQVTTLGDYGPLRFRDLRVIPVVERFKHQLREIEAAIDDRDRSRLISYPFLRPSRILQSISI
jgi:arachidonate 15-lipoxygenase